jgi:hypothetical protein
MILVMEGPMSTADARPAATDPQAWLDLEEVCRRLSEWQRVTDPELIRRVERRAAESRAEALRLSGVQEIAVDIVREMRDPKG